MESTIYPNIGMNTKRVTKKSGGFGKGTSKNGTARMRTSKKKTTASKIT